MKADATLDCIGLYCPMPIAHTAKKIKELEENIGTLTKERDDLLEQKAEAEKSQQIAETKAQVDEALAGAELPDAAKARLAERFKDATSTEGLEEAISAERDYVAALTESGKVKDMGDSKTDDKADTEALKESFKRLGMTDEQAETAVKGR